MPSQSDSHDLEELADGMSLWQEHKPQSPEDWLRVATRWLELDPPENPSPMFGSLYLAVRALYDCAKESGADVSDGAPTWPLITEWAVREVKQLRIDSEE